MRYSATTHILRPGEQTLLVITPHGPNTIFHPRTIRAVELGSTFHVQDVVVDKWNAIDGEPIPAASLPDVILDPCVVPASITFLIRNCGRASGRLHVEISDEVEIHGDDLKDVFVN